jgi:hypothetical protein
MNRWAMLGLGTLGLVGGAAAIGFGAYRNAMAEAAEAYARLAECPARPPVERYDAAMVAGLPEIAQRYFRHAIAPGTAVYSTVVLEMEGTFLLGDKDNFQTYTMSARQVLRTPDQFVWMPRMRSGAMTISGSDALVGGEAWTRFWLLGLVPVAQDRTSPDLVRSAQFRAAVESALSLPTSLLPMNGVDWEQVDENRARLTFRRFSPAIILDMTLDQSGAVQEVVGQRWSNANPDKTFRLQPFGGTMGADRTFQGLTIPTAIAAGNHYGTSDYLPFFQVRITSAKYF